MTEHKSDLEYLEKEDPAQFRDILRQAHHEQLRSQKTFGGYLAWLRGSTGRTVSEMAEKADVSASRWANWEADCYLPEPDAVFDVMKRLYYPLEEAEKLVKLLQEAPRHIIEELSYHNLALLAADGLQTLDLKRFWESVPKEARQMLYRWAESSGYRFPEDLLVVVAELGTDEERSAWVQQVLESRP